MTFDEEVRFAVYGFFADTGRSPSVDDVAGELGVAPAGVREAFTRLEQAHVWVLHEDGQTLRMAFPFSGVRTPHRVEADGRSYFANCAWDAFGIPAALGKPATVRSRCSATGEALELEILESGPTESTAADSAVVQWRYHCLVPAARWWDDIGFT